MSRMYNQDGHLYKGALDCVLKTVKSEGFLSVYKGFSAHLARILPHTVRKPSPAIDRDTYDRQILTLTLNEQTMKIMRRIEDRYFATDKL